MNLNMGEVQDKPGVAKEEELAGGFRILNSMPDFWVGEKSVAGVLTGFSA